MNVFLWVLQGLLAVVFLGSGGMKVARGKKDLEPMMSWTTHTSAAGVKAVGAVEILGALGLILPAATGIAVVLTPIAAAGLAVTMLGAVIVHVRLKDKINEAVPSAVLLVLAAIVAWGRFGPYHF
jgi:uncharacterized membrane protein YphA (DoxX/SURF4 family)